MKRRETLSALDVFVLARELTASLAGGYVDKVHQLGPDDVLLRINARGGAGRVSLLLLGGRRVLLTKRELNVPERPSTFAMASRARLGNARVKAVEQVGFDRILMVRLTTADGDCDFVAEMLPDGAVALVDKGVTVVAAKPKIFKDRKVAPKQPYAGPAAGKDPRGIGAEGIGESLKGAEGDLAKALSSRAHMGPGLAQEVVARAGLDGKKPAASTSPAQCKTLFAALEEVMLEAEKSPAPQALLEGDAMVDFAPTPQKRWGGAATRSFATMSELLDAYFEAPAGAPKPKTEAVVQSEEHDQAVAKLERVEAQQKAAVQALEAEVAEAVGAAEAVYANYAQVENFLRLAKPWGSAKQLAELVQRAGLEAKAPEVSASGRGIVVDLTGPDGVAHRVEIEQGSSVNEIAQVQYRLASRAKERLRGAAEALAETDAALETARRKRARTDRVHAARAKDAEAVSGPLVPPQPKKREWFERFRWMRASDGTLIVAGRDAGTNDQLVKKYLKPGDRYAHADIHGAPSVVIKRPEGAAEISEAALAEGCAFAALMSRAWASGAAEASAYWVTPDQVSKTPESGESLGRGAFVIRGKRNTVRHVTLRAAVGGLTINGERKAMCGPTEAVAAQCDGAFAIEPGKRKATDAAKELAAKIRVHPDEIARALPSGNVEVLAALDVGRGAASAGEDE